MSKFLKPKKIFNHKSNEEVYNAKIIGGNPNGIFNFNQTNHKWAKDIYDKMKARTWFPGQISTLKDIVNYAQLSESNKRSFDLFLAQLIANDSIQTNQLMDKVNSYITSPIVNACLSVQASEEANHCLIEGTEILTIEGFKLFKDLTYDDKVAVQNDDDEITFEHPSDIIYEDISDSENELIEIIGRNYHKIVTKNHRVPIIKHKKPTIIYAEKLNESGVFLYQVPGKLSNSDKDSLDRLPTIDKLKLLALFNVTRDFFGGYKIFLDKNHRANNMIEELLNSFPNLTLTSICTLQDEIEYEFTTDIELEDFQLNLDWLSLEDKDANYFREFISFLLEIYGSDSDLLENRLKIFNIESIIEKIMIAATLGGIAVERLGLPNDMFVKLIFDFENRPRKSDDITVREHKYEGKVGCCTVSTGKIICKYDEAIFLTGNSNSYAVLAEDVCQESEYIYNLHKYDEELQRKNRAVEDMFNAIYEKEEEGFKSHLIKLLFDNPFIDFLADRFKIVEDLQIRMLSKVQVTSEDLLLAFVGNQILEELVFPGGFVGIYALEDLLPGSSGMISEIQKDETLSHVELFKNIFRTAVEEEFDGVIPKRVEEKAIAAIKKMTEAEIRWTLYASKGLDGFSEESVRVFVEGQANSVCRNLGLKRIYPKHTLNPLRKLLTSHLKGGEYDSRTNFFEKRPVEYNSTPLIQDL